MGYYYPEGLSNRSGAHRMMRGALYTSNQVIYVDSADGDDSSDGTSYLRPKKTLQSASDAVAVDEHTIIVLKHGFKENVTSTITFNNKLVSIIGESRVGPGPECEVVLSYSDEESVFSQAQDANEIINVSFPPRTVSPASGTPANVVTAPFAFVTDCLFLAGDKDKKLLEIGGISEVKRCVFKSAEEEKNPDEVTAIDIGGFPSHSVTDCELSAGPFGTVYQSVGAKRFLNASLLLGCKIVAGPGTLVGNGTVVATVGKSTLGGGLTDIPEDGEIFPSGLSSFGGDELVDGKYTYVSQTPIFVDSENGSDLNDGSSCSPLATLAEAVSQSNAASSSQVIVLRSTHLEEMTSEIEVTSPVTIVGESGATVGMSADESGLVLIGNGISVEIRNVIFTANVQLTDASESMLRIHTTGTRIIDCQFLMDDFFRSRAVTVTGSGANAPHGAYFEGCKFLDFTTSEDKKAAGPLFVNSDALYFSMKDCEFDGGAFGFDFEAITILAVPSLRISGLKLSNCVDLSIADGSTGYVQIEESDDTCHVEAF